MKWIGERISFVDDKAKTTIVIYPENVAWVKGLMGAWVAMWTVIGATIVWSYYTFKLTNQENLIIYIFMAFWLYYAIKVFRSFAWLMWGKELVKINEASFTYKKSVKNYGKATPFYFENIKKISVSTPKKRSFQAVWEASPWIRGGERLEFEYMGKVVRFGRKLQEKEAKLLFNLITKKIEEKMKKKKD
jgi:hypothetical protein